MFLLLDTHTKGPWTVNPESHGNYLVIRSEHRQAAICRLTYKLEADAKLISAAPDLLEALVNIENDDGRIPETIWAMRNAAIAKARGID